MGLLGGEVGSSLHSHAFCLVFVPLEYVHTKQKIPVFSLYVEKHTKKTYDNQKELLLDKHTSAFNLFDIEILDFITSK